MTSRCVDVPDDQKRSVWCDGPDTDISLNNKFIHWSILRAGVRRPADGAVERVK